MSTSRNAPCPCGSGRKYKACCMPRDLARERVKAVVGEEALEAAEAQLRSLAGQQAVWEADVVPLPVMAADATPALVLVTAGEVIVHGETVQHRPLGVDERAAVIAQAVSAAARASTQLPPRLHVRDAELAAALEPRLRARGMEVRAAGLAALDGAVGQVMGPAMAVNLATPDTWRETGASREELGEFHAAAAEFHRLAPWSRLETQLPLLMDFVGSAQWGASVMGEAGMAFGLALYSDPADMVALLEAEDPRMELPAMRGYGLTVDLDERAALSRTMQREIIAAGWAIAGPRAYPRLFALNTPEGCVTAAHVGQATLALRAVNALARGGDPQAETGVRVSLLPGGGYDDDWDEEDDRLNYFSSAEQAAPICPEGPGAAPESAIGAWDEHEAMKAAEEARLARLEAWLHASLQNVRTADLENARTWTDHLVGMAIPAGAFTEHDLRLFLYDLYVRKSKPSKRAVKAIRASLYSIFRFLEVEEGIRYPFADAVLEELAEIERRAKADGMALHEALAALRYEVYDDLDLRLMLPRGESVDGLVHWPGLMSLPVAELDRELQRRWLLWYDEAVRRGITDFVELEDVLVARQREWENTPHPAHGGRTPAEVVGASVASESFPVEPQGEMAG